MKRRIAILYAQLLAEVSGVFEVVLTLHFVEDNFLELAVLSSKENVTLTINGQSVSIEI